MICRRNFSCVEKLTQINDRIQYHSAMTMFHIWTQGSTHQSRSILGPGGTVRCAGPHQKNFEILGPQRTNAVRGSLIWTSSYLMNQTHIATIGIDEIYRFDEKDIRPFFPVNFIDLYRLKTVATGNYEADTELKYRIGSYLFFF